MAKNKSIQTELIDIKKVKSNPNNPRIIKDDKFQQLVKSIEDFPQMLELRPIVVNDKMIVLGGNMRLKACIEAKLKQVHIIKASNLTSAQQKEFIIKDNVGFGEWEWNDLANEWESEDLNNWGLDVPEFEEDVDYDILNSDNLSTEISRMTNGVKKAIQIEFDLHDFEEAKELVKFWREKKAYVGKMLVDTMKANKVNL